MTYGINLVHEVEGERFRSATLPERHHGRNYPLRQLDKLPD
jgi:hypothetical protein